MESSRAKLISLPQDSHTSLDIKRANKVLLIPRGTALNTVEQLYCIANFWILSIFPAYVEERRLVLLSSFHKRSQEKLSYCREPTMNFDDGWQAECYFSPADVCVCDICHSTLMSVFKQKVDCEFRLFLEGIIVFLDQKKVNPYILKKIRAIRCTLALTINRWSWLTVVW